MRITPIEKFGVESFFGCNGVLFGGAGGFSVVGSLVVEVGGLIALECGCGGCWGWWSFYLVIVGGG